MLIEDDLDVAKELALSLRKWGFEVEIIDRFNNIVKKFLKSNQNFKVDISRNGQSEYKNKYGYAINIEDHKDGNIDYSESVWEN